MRRTPTPGTRVYTEHRRSRLVDAPPAGLRLGDVLLIAHKVVAGRVTQVGLQLAEPDTNAKQPAKPAGRIKSALRRGVARSV